MLAKSTDNTGAAQAASASGGKATEAVGQRYRIVLEGLMPPSTLRVPQPDMLSSSLFRPRQMLTLCSIQYYRRFWLGICRTSLAVSALGCMLVSQNSVYFFCFQICL